MDESLGRRKIVVFTNVSRAKSRTSELLKSRSMEGGRENVKAYKCATRYSCVKLISEARVMLLMCRASFTSQDCGVCGVLGIHGVLSPCSGVASQKCITADKRKRRPPLEPSSS